jgi:hypothetical protein
MAGQNQSGRAPDRGSLESGAQAAALPMIPLGGGWPETGLLVGSVPPATLVPAG